MDDLVAHLRRSASQQDMLACEDMLQAANAIEALEAALREIDKRLEGWTGVVARAAVKDIQHIIRSALPKDENAK